MLIFWIQFYFNIDTIFLESFLSSLFFLIIWNSPLFVKHVYRAVCFWAFFSVSLVSLLFLMLVPPCFNLLQFYNLSSCQLGQWLLSLGRYQSQLGILVKIQRHGSYFNTAKSLCSLLSNTHQCSKTMLQGKCKPTQPIFSYLRIIWVIFFFKNGYSCLLLLLIHF